MSDGSGDRMIRDQILLLRIILICNIVACMSTGKQEGPRTLEPASERGSARLEASSSSAHAWTCREITSAELFKGSREIHIRHAEQIYTLRQTSKGKLILTK